MRKYFLLIGFVAALVLISGCIQPTTPESQPTPQQPAEKWFNPEINCTINDRETPIKQYPYNPNLTDEERIDPIGMLDFCSRMSQEFDESNLNVDEANEIYTVLFNAKILRDESYGMPSPDAPPKSELSIDELKKRIAIKKTGEHEYETFYSKISCGTNYSHTILTIENKEITNTEEIERWSGSYPC